MSAAPRLISALRGSFSCPRYCSHKQSTMVRVTIAQRQLTSPRQKGLLMFRLLFIALLISATTGVHSAMAQAPATAGRPPRPPAPTRDPNTPGYVTAKELPDGANAPVNADGTFILGPTHNPAPEMTVQEGVPQGDAFNFTMESTDSKIYPGIAREANTFARTDPADPTKLIVASHPAPYTRRVAVYIPNQYVPGTVAPSIAGPDGPDPALFTRLATFTPPP